MDPIIKEGVVSNQQDGAFKMPSRGGVTSNAMTYTDTLHRHEPARFQELFKIIFGSTKVDVDWVTLDFDKVQSFLRAWYFDTAIKLIKVAKHADEDSEEISWELYFFKEEGSTNSVYWN